MRKTPRNQGRQALDITTIHQFQRINGVHVAAFGVFRHQPLDPLHDQGVENKNKNGKHNQPSIFTNHCVILRSGAKCRQYTRKKGKGKEKRRTLLMPGEERIFAGKRQ
jgi:hypothetical protein